LLAGWSDRVQISLYLNDDAGARDRDGIERYLKSLPAVESYEYVSKEHAVERFKNYFPELETLPNMLESNPLPASFEIQVAADFHSPDGIRLLAEDLKKQPGVVEVDYDLLWIERLTSVIDLVRALGLFIGGALVVASVFTIFNVIKLTVYGRQEEIDIMRLVGATHAYIRGPFLVEGMLQGGLGGAVAIGLLYAAYELLLRQALESFRLLSGANWIQFLSAPALGGLILGGMTVGLLGATLSVRKFLSEF
jgi:cell division transport system permease protein